MTGTAVGQPEWLRSRVFDVGFIGGTAAVALGSAFAVVARPELFGLVLALDLWLLGYHHVISTFTRFLADRSTARDHPDLLTWWPVAIAALVVGLGFGVGPWALVTIYLYWQWFHYVRQSWGIARAYERKSGAPRAEPAALFTVMFYSLPVWGILHRSHQDPDRFLRVDVWTIPVPGIVVEAAGAVAAILIATTLIIRYRAWRQGELPVVHTMMVLSHLVVFAFGYVIIDDIDAGWLAVNIWHNIQYIAFVWHVNNRQAAAAQRPGFVQRLSGNGRLVHYLVVSVVASTAIYVAIGLTLAAVVTPVIVYQAINFHHYVVDGKIWKSRRPSVQPPLGLT
ncbi:MAG: hypothetical protein OEV40_01475 [Acidimicrobiia bacterium]|nr:hypothetical protein [Acidimicrobiia bacterium]